MKTKKAVKALQSQATVNAQKRKRYSPEFISQSLERAEKFGVAQTARSLEIPESVLYRWRAEAKTNAEMTDQERADHSELLSLRKQINALSEENAFLKKQRRTLPSNPGEVRLDRKASANLWCRQAMRLAARIGVWILRLANAL